jgi:hypothetical protein
MMGITETIRKLLAVYADNYGLDAWHINCGECKEFALDVVEALGGDTDQLGAYWHDDMPDCTEVEAYTFAHCFIRYAGRFYDSECPEGVDSWRELPYFIAAAPAIPA